jgi:Zn-finger nucleic acid-binding protein
MEKPLTEEYFGWTNKKRVTLQTECRVCKKAYMDKWRLNKLLSKDPEEKRMKEMYTIKEYTEEEKQERMNEAYAYMHYQAFGKPIPAWKLKELEGIEE